jgi:GH24 family phage-related lysozyme (muramidase)
MTCLTFQYSKAQNPAYQPPVNKTTKQANVVVVTWKDIVVAELKRREGFASRPYKDKEVWTIGYGLHVEKWADMPKYPISEAQAELYMNKRLMSDYENVERVFPHFSENEKWALTSLVYNKGMTSVKNNTALWNALHLKDMEALKKLWISEFSNTSNHKYSRELEWALFSLNEERLRTLYEDSAVIVESRNARKVDFSKIKKTASKKK